MVEKKQIKRIALLIRRFIEFYRFSDRREISRYTEMHNMPNGIAEQISKSEWQTKGEFYDTLHKLNVGDCPVIAMAVSEVLRLEGVGEILFHNNGGHYYFSVMVKAYNRSAAMVFVDGVDASKKLSVNQRLYFDAFHPEGTLDATSLLQHRNPAIRQNRMGDSTWLAEDAFPDDHLGKEWVEQFVRFYFPDYRYPYAISDRPSEVYGETY